MALVACADGGDGAERSAQLGARYDHPRGRLEPRGAAVAAARQGLHPRAERRQQLGEEGGRLLVLEREAQVEIRSEGALGAAAARTLRKLLDALAAALLESLEDLDA